MITLSRKLPAYSRLAGGARFNESSSPTSNDNMNVLSQITMVPPAISCVFPFDVSLNIGWYKEKYPTSCGHNKARAQTLTRRPQMRKNTFVKRA